MLKKKLEIAADHCKKDMKLGLKYLQGIGFLSDPIEPTALARFFKDTPKLDVALKNKYGEYIGEPDAINRAVLEQYHKYICHGWVVGQ